MRVRAKTTKIIIHCSATRNEWMAGQGLAGQVREIRKWHVEERGWTDIGYNGLVGRGGSYLQGRLEKFQGAHTRGQNHISVGVCLIGGHGASQHDMPEDHFTEEQLKTLLREVKRLQDKYPGATVHGHNEFAAKACPGFDVQKHWPRLVSEYGEQGQKRKAAPWWVRLLNLLKGKN